MTPSSATGNITFYDSTTILGTAPVSGGQATLTTTLLPSGKRSLRAYFAQGSTYGASTSATLSQIIGANPLTSTGFHAASTYAAGTTPQAVTAADFNGDNIPDLAVANYGSGNVSILLGQGNGSFAAPVNYATGSYASAVVAGDFNGDGKVDLAVLNNYPTSVSILLGNGDGTFHTALNYALANGGGNSIAMADFNGDGKPDLAIAMEGTGVTSALLFGNGDGTFQVTTNPLLESSYFVVAADFNNDGKADLAVINAQNALTVLPGNGDGTFQAGGNFAVAGSVLAVTTGDFNGDGKADVALTVYNGLVYVALGNGDGSFQTPVSYAVGSNPRGVVTGDVNGDGKPDLIVSSEGANNVSVLLGNGDGTFQTAVNYSVASTPQGLVLDDFNGDGTIDIAAATNTGASILLGIPPVVNSVTLTSSLNPSVVGQSVTLTATVSPSSLTGTVTFYDGTASLGTGTLASGSASLSLTSLASGTHSLTAVYGGTTSAVLTQTVSAGAVLTCTTSAATLSYVRAEGTNRTTAVPHDFGMHRGHKRLDGILRHGKRSIQQCVEQRVGCTKRCGSRRQRILIQRHLVHSFCHPGRPDHDAVLFQYDPGIHGDVRREHRDLQPEGQRIAGTCIGVHHPHTFRRQSGDAGDLGELRACYQSVEQPHFHRLDQRLALHRETGRCKCRRRGDYLGCVCRCFRNGCSGICAAKPRAAHPP